MCEKLTTRRARNIRAEILRARQDAHDAGYDPLYDATTVLDLSTRYEKVAYTRTYKRTMDRNIDNMTAEEVDSILQRRAEARMPQWERVTTRLEDRLQAIEEVLGIEKH